MKRQHNEVGQVQLARVPMDPRRGQGPKSAGHRGGRAGAGAPASLIYRIRNFSHSTPSLLHTRNYVSIAQRMY